MAITLTFGCYGDPGAALVQLYTGFIYEGPALVSAICRALR